MRLVSFADKASALNDPNRRAGLEFPDLRDKVVVVELANGERHEVTDIEFQSNGNRVVITIQ